MSLQTDGVWKGAVWASTVWASGVWYESSGPSPSPAPSPDPVLLGGKAYGWSLPYAKHEEEEYQRKLISDERERLLKTETRLVQAERLERELAQEKAAGMAALEASLQDEINRLRIERDWLIRRIDDEETALVLLLSSPFH